MRAWEIFMASSNAAGAFTVCRSEHACQPKIAAATTTAATRIYVVNCLCERTASAPCAKVLRTSSVFSSLREICAKSSPRGESQKEMLPQMLQQRSVPETRHATSSREPRLAEAAERGFFV